MGGAINTNSTKGSSNFSGTIQSTVQSNPTAGFSIITYTANNTANSTIGHELGAVPKYLIIRKNLQHKKMVCLAGDPREYMYLDGNFEDKQI